MTLEERLRSHYESLVRTIQFTRSVDAKAAPVLGLQIALVGTIAARFDKLLPVFTADEWSNERVAVFVLGALYLGVVLVVLGLAVSVYMPKHPPTGNSLIYFEDIARMKFTNFKAISQAMSSDVIECQLLDQIHRVSKIVSGKMNRVRWALILSCPATGLWAALLVYGSIAAD